MLPDCPSVANPVVILMIPDVPSCPALAVAKLRLPLVEKEDLPVNSDMEPPLALVASVVFPA